MKYHLRPSDGKLLPCKAQEGKCKYGENLHFSGDSLEEVQKKADETNRVILKRLDTLKRYSELEDKAISPLRVQIRAFNRKLGLNPFEGIYSKEEIEQKEKEKAKRELELKKEEELSLLNRDNFRKLKSIPVPEKLLLNDIVKYDKSKIYGKAYRGENVKQEGTKGNGGMALYGQGLYSTTDKSYAKKFGEVRLVNYDELPSNPLSLKNRLSFDYLEQLIKEKYKIKSEHFYDENWGPRELVQKIGFDGVSIGSGKYMSPISRSSSGKRELFGQMDILLVVSAKERVMTQSKNILRNKDNRSHSCAQLKTDHFSGSVKYKIDIQRKRSLLKVDLKKAVEEYNSAKEFYPKELEKDNMKAFSKLTSKFSSKKDLYEKTEYVY